MKCVIFIDWLLFQSDKKKGKIIIKKKTEHVVTKKYLFNINVDTSLRKFNAFSFL